MLKMDGMNIYYDDEGDYLEITMGDISNCYFDNLSDGIFQIIDKNTNEIKGISIHSFKERTKDLNKCLLNQSKVF